MELQRNRQRCTNRSRRQLLKNPARHLCHREPATLPAYDVAAAGGKSGSKSAARSQSSCTVDSACQAASREQQVRAAAKSTILAHASDATRGRCELGGSMRRQTSRRNASREASRSRGAAQRRRRAAGGDHGRGEVRRCAWAEGCRGRAATSSDKQQPPFSRFPSEASPLGARRAPRRAQAYVMAQQAGNLEPCLRSWALRTPTRAHVPIRRAAPLRSPLLRVVRVMPLDLWSVAIS